ncbi:MAG TPA: tetratricopeptide repeat protein, partial [Gemmataceae bacterium]
QELAATFPGEPAYQADLAATHQAFGDLLAATGRWAAAGEAYRAALALREKLAGGDECPTRAFELAVTRNALGRVRAASGDACGAEALDRAAVAALAEHADAGPGWELALAAAELDLGRLLAANRAEEAEPVARRAADRADAVARQLPAAPAPRELAAGAWALVGELAADRPDAAAAAFAKALAARRWLADRPAARPRDRAELAWLLCTCPDCRFRDPAAAVAAATAAADQAPQDARVWTRLGVARCRAGDWRAAAEALQRAEKLRPGGERTARLFLAVAYRELGDEAAARQWAAKAEAGPAAADAEWTRLRAEAAAWLDE